MNDKQHLQNLAEKVGPSNKGQEHNCTSTCSAHPSDVELTNIALKFLPQNTISDMQPMDMG